MKTETKSALTATMIDQAMHIIRNPDEWPNHQQWARTLIEDWVVCGFPEYFDSGDYDLFKASYGSAFKPIVGADNTVTKP